MVLSSPLHYTETQLKNIGYDIPNWKNDHKYLLDRLKSAFPNFIVNGDECSFQIVVAKDFFEEKDYDYINNYMLLSSYNTK